MGINISITQTNGERIIYLEVNIGKTGILYRKDSLNPFIPSFTKVYTLWIKDLNVKKENYKMNRRKYPIFY